MHPKRIIHQVVVVILVVRILMFFFASSRVLESAQRVHYVRCTFNETLSVKVMAKSCSRAVTSVIRKTTSSSILLCLSLSR